jgi:RAB6A-GEF complex partner protein 1
MFYQSHLFLHHVLLFHLEAGQVKESVNLAAHYQHLVFFAHALEILLHTAVESESESTIEPENGDDESEAPVASDGVLSTVVEFLDHFDVALDVVVGCARKTEMTRWRRLFNIVGNPKTLFEVCASLPIPQNLLTISPFFPDLSQLTTSENCRILPLSPA